MNATSIPACDTDTLGAVCAGDCGRRLHHHKWGQSRRICVDGHPIVEAHGLCRGCDQARRRATSRIEVTMDWQDDAVCRGADPGRFIPDIPSGVAGAVHDIVGPVAHDFCDVCPVRQRCSDFADATTGIGLWGGSWRRWQGSHYDRVPLIDGLRLGPLRMGRRAS